MSRPVEGFLIVDKPGGITSHDVVARIRKRLHRNAKVGHAGTLDPMATGVLIICVGQATRLAEWVTNENKRYQAEITLGIETATYDALGDIVAEKPVTIAQRDVEVALNLFRGTVVQRPPAFSAIKVDGERLYKLARRGEEVEAPERTITIESLQLLSCDLPRVSIDVMCSKGTYIRSIAHDLGVALGTGGHLSGLRRLSSGRFKIEDAHPLDEILTAIEEKTIESWVLPLADGVHEMARLMVDPGVAAELRFGRPWHLNDRGLEPTTVDRHRDGMLARAHDDADRLVAVVEFRKASWWPVKVFTPR